MILDNISIWAPQGHHDLRQHYWLGGMRKDIRVYLSHCISYNRWRQSIWGLVVIFRDYPFRSGSGIAWPWIFWQDCLGLLEVLIVLGSSLIYWPRHHTSSLFSLHWMPRDRPISPFVRRFIYMVCRSLSYHIGVLSLFLASGDLFRMSWALVLTLAHHSTHKIMVSRSVPFRFLKICLGLVL